jgi:hypothetical protein
VSHFAPTFSNLPVVATTHEYVTILCRLPLCIGCQQRYLFSLSLHSDHCDKAPVCAQVLYTEAFMVRRRQSIEMPPTPVRIMSWNADHMAQWDGSHVDRQDFAATRNESAYPIDAVSEQCILSIVIAMHRTSLALVHPFACHLSFAFPGDAFSLACIRTPYSCLG